MRPDTFTITTFWLDWLLMPILLAGAWLTIRWALADSRQASDLEAGGDSFMPAWAFSIPLFIAAAAWVIAGFGTLIKEDYWEMRVIFGAFALWTLCCIVGAALLFLGFLRKGRDFGIAGILNLIGLALMSLLMVLPGLIDHSSPANVTLVGHVWFLLLAVCVGLFTGGTLLGFPYKFPQFPLGLGVLFFIGWGLSEVAFSQASFPWLVRIWKLRLGLEYLDAFPTSAGWQVAGATKFLVGIGTVVILVIASRRRNAKESTV
ncbi:MAG: hypothetical protein SWK90_08530 [Chloroflexota bacterium]|nr:hypothetical protein [Chloroflexota bacterium]